MKKLVIGTLLIGFLVSLFACMEKIDISRRPADYQYHQTSLHAKVHWSYRYEAASLIIEGLVESWSGEVKLQDISVTALLYDAQGKLIKKQSARPQMAIINPGELTPFRMIIVELPGKPARIKLEENYEPVRSY